MVRVIDFEHARRVGGLQPTKRAGRGGLQAAHHPTKVNITMPGSGVFPVFVIESVT